MTSAIPLSQLVFPVFRLGTSRPSVVDEVTFYYYENYKEVDDELVTVEVLRIIDDKSVEGSTLAMRRLRLKNEGVPILRMRHAVFFLGDLIKLAKPNIWFIDSTGRVFTYTKQTRAKLTFHKIKQMFPIRSGGVIVEAVGVISRFKSLFYPESDKTHIGLLHLGLGVVLYGFYTEQHKDTWRMV